jgi:hypothetical protein
VQDTPYNLDDEFGRSYPPSAPNIPPDKPIGPVNLDDEFVRKYNPALGPDKTIVRTGESQYGAPNWAKEHPLTAGFLEDIGVTAATLPAMALGQEYAAIPLASRLATIGPRAAQAVDFLSGSGGVLSSATRGALEGAEASGLEYPYTKYAHPEDATDLKGNLLRGAVTGAALRPGSNLLFGRSAISQENADAALSALRQGVPIRPGQVPGAARGFSWLDSLASGNANAGQRTAWNRAVTRTAGLESADITPQWANQAERLHGGTMENIALNHQLDPHDPHLNANMLNIYDQAQGLGLFNAPNSRLDAEGRRNFNRIWNSVNGEILQGIHSGNGVAGTVYQGWTQRGGLLYEAMKDPTMRPYARAMKDAVDDAWGRSIQNSAHPEDFLAWQNARRYYKNVQSIKDDIDEKTGEYDPRKLLADVQKRSSTGFAAGAGDIGALARVGQWMAKPNAPPQTETPFYRAARHALYGAEAAGGIGLAGLGNHLMPDLTEHLLSTAGDPATLAALGISAASAKTAANVLANPRVATHLLNVAAGLRSPLFRDVNPLAPAAVFMGEGAERQ